MSVLGTLGFTALVVLPGAWITFGLPLRGLSSWNRFLIGVALSPVVGGGQFFVLRWSGASFELIPLLLLALNFPVLLLAARRIEAVRWPTPRTLIGAVLVAAVPLTFLVLLLHDPFTRAFSGHTWMHGDIIYQLANGRLGLEEPALAGVALSYPWFAHVYQSVLSYLLGTPPTVNYFFTNLIWLLVVFALTASVVRELGGNWFSQIAAIIWLAFAVNFVGGTLGWIIPAEFFGEYPIPLWGDWRYTPLIRQFLFFNQMPFGLALFAAAIVLLVRDALNGDDVAELLTLGLVLCGIAITYPLLFPPAAVVVAGRALGLSWIRLRERKRLPYSQILRLAAVVVVGALVTLGYLSFLGQDRTGQPTIQLPSFYEMKLRAVQGFLVLLPLLVAAAIAFRVQWRTRQVALFALLIGALGSALAPVVIHIPHHRNEYKFMFTAAICLAPYASLAFEPVMNRLGRAAWSTLALITLVLMAPAVRRAVVSPPYFPEDPPAVDLRSFDLRLGETERYADLSDVIRTETPLNTVLVAERTGIHLPTVTRRSLYVPFENEPFPGVNLSRDQLLIRVKGYDQALLDERLSVLSGLFDDAVDDALRARSFQTILELGRPVAVVLDDRLQAGLASWLAGREDGAFVYRGRGLSVWLLGDGSLARGD